MNDANPTPDFAELHCLSNFSFLRGASHADELVETAAALGYRALAITDECSLAGIVRAHQAARRVGLPLIVGGEFALSDDEQGWRLVLLVEHAAGYTALCELITRARRRADKGEYRVDRTDFADFKAGLSGCCTLLVPPSQGLGWADDDWLGWFAEHFAGRGWLAVELHRGPQDAQRLSLLRALSQRHALPLVAADDVHMHSRGRRALQDAVTCIRHGCTLAEAGYRLFANGERHLRRREDLAQIYPRELLAETLTIADRCRFSLDELGYQYPAEVVPEGRTPMQHLRELTEAGARERWPDGVPQRVRELIEHELALIGELAYAHYFLTVHDIVRFARSRNILCQGRGSAANSAVCYCLGITEVDPSRISVLFERFISKERDEPPDIDVDFEHERREEVIQYLYRKYGRERAALAATVISYRPRSAIRDLSKVLGMDPAQVDLLAASITWWDDRDALAERLAERGLSAEDPTVQRLLWLLDQLVGMPRHLSQHVGGFVISEQPLATLVPVENAAMAERTVIQWDKDDLEALGLMKVDVLALGMLTAIRKCLDLIGQQNGRPMCLQDIPADDPATWAMIQRADTVGVFQIESRAQMSMLPRLRPACFYDLVIEVAIVRPGPIQGGMVNPYLLRRQGLEVVHYPSEALRPVLERTLGVPVFQEQVMQLAMVAAGFTAGEADALRRAMAAWRRNGSVERFRGRLLGGMRERGYDAGFAEAIYRQIRGFGEYGFPESHAASFALLAWVSSWLKCHHPAAFTCALLNSQPMGFYAPSDLVRDAREHGVEVKPVDVLHSQWDHTLAQKKAAQPALRLGLRLVKGLSQAGAERLIDRRTSCQLNSTRDLAVLDSRDREALADAGALRSLTADRHAASWAVSGIEALPGLLDRASAEEAQLDLPATSEAAEIVADYASLGLTLGRHPLALLRPQLKARGMLSVAEWGGVEDGRPARLAGLVRIRQRPGSAEGVVFITIEDETGIANVIVWSKLVARCRDVVVGSRLLAVWGTTQREGEVVHLVAGRLESWDRLLGELELVSRDFH